MIDESTKLVCLFSSVATLAATVAVATGGHTPIRTGFAAIAVGLFSIWVVSTAIRVEQRPSKGR